MLDYLSNLSDKWIQAPIPIFLVWGLFAVFSVVGLAAIRRAFIAQNVKTRWFCAALVAFTAFIVINFSPPNAVGSLLFLTAIFEIASIIGFFVLLKPVILFVRRTLQERASTRFLINSACFLVALSALAFLQMEGLRENPRDDFSDIGRVLSEASGTSLPNISSLDISNFPDVEVYPYEFPNTFRTHLACYSGNANMDRNVSDLFFNLGGRNFDDDYSDLLNLLSGSSADDAYLQTIFGIALDDGIGFADISNRGALRDMSLEYLSDAFDNGSTLAGYELAEGYSYNLGAWFEYPSLRNSDEAPALKDLYRDVNERLVEQLAEYEPTNGFYGGRGRFSRQDRALLDPLRSPRDPSTTWFGNRQGDIGVVDVLRLISEKLTMYEIEEFGQPGVYSIFVQGLLEYWSGNHVLAVSLMLEADKACSDFHVARSFIAINMLTTYLDNYSQSKFDDAFFLEQSEAIDYASDQNTTPPEARFLEKIQAARELLVPIKYQFPMAAFNMASIINREANLFGVVGNTKLNWSLYREMVGNFQLAARQGHPEAAYELTRNYVYPEGYELDLEESWFYPFTGDLTPRQDWAFEPALLASALGNKDARRTLKGFLSERDEDADTDRLLSLNYAEFLYQVRIDDYEKAEAPLKEIVDLSVGTLDEQRLDFAYGLLESYMNLAELPSWSDEMREADNVEEIEAMEWKSAALSDAESSLKMIDSLRRNLFDSGIQQGSTLTAAKETKNYALLIGNDDYEALPNLKTPMKDVELIKRMLEESFGYEVTILANANRQTMLEAINQFRQELTRSDNFLLYYAGHGTLDNVVDEGYWQPVDSDPFDDTNWIPTSRIETVLRGFTSNNVLVVADSCFSGVLTRGVTPVGGETQRGLPPGLLEDFLNNKTRVAISSGNLEPVLDSVPGQENSQFAVAFYEALQGLSDAKAASNIFGAIRENLDLSLAGTGFSQTPQYSVLRRASHEGGDFIFFPK